MSERIDVVRLRPELVKAMSLNEALRGTKDYVEGFSVIMPSDPYKALNARVSFGNRSDGLDGPVTADFIKEVELAYARAKMRTLSDLLECLDISYGFKHHYAMINGVPYYYQDKNVVEEVRKAVETIVAMRREVKQTLQQLNLDVGISESIEAPQSQTPEASEGADFKPAEFETVEPADGEKVIHAK